MERYLAEARIRELRLVGRKAAIERAIGELYGEEAQERRSIDRGLFARYTWYGFHLPQDA